MDSQENALTQGTEEVKQAEEANKVNPPSGEETAPIAAETAEDAQQAQEEELAKKVYTSKKEIVDRLGEIAKSETTPDKAEIEHLKTTFYKLHFAEREAEQKAFVEAGGDPEKFQILPDDDEQAFKAEMTIIKEKRQKAFQELEQLKQDNLQKKLEIIEKIKAMVTTAEEANANFQNFKALQAEWKEIKPVPAEKANELWRNYQLYVEQFYDLINLNREAREYDFKKNLEKKTALCEKVEAIVKEENKTNTDWERHTQEILDVQQEWKKIGFAAPKVNQKIFDRFRAACDDFFGRKNAHYKERRAQYSENADKKRELIAKAKELMDSTEWRKTADKLIELQKEWKTIGQVPDKLGDELWKEFREACDHFFDARTAAFADVHKEEDENLKKKQEVIARLQALLDEGKDEGDLQKKVQALSDEFFAIGHVPMKQKEKTYQAFRTLLDKFYKELHVNSSRRRMDNFRSNLRQVATRGGDALDTERGRLMRRYEQLKNDINTYENNLGFLNVSSKKGNSLIEEMKRKVQRLRDELEETRQKIKAVDAENKDQEAVQSKE